MTEEENKTLKRTLRHYLDLECYANGVDADMQDLLNELIAECDKIIESHSSYSTKDAYNIVIKAIKEKVAAFTEQLEDRMEAEAEFVKNNELDFLENLYDPALAIGAVSAAKLLFSPIDGRDTTEQFVERTQKNIIRSYDTSMRTGYLFGQSSKDIKAQAAEKMKQISRGMQRAIRTAIPSYAKTTDNIVFLKNNAEVIYCATLDGHTCIVCGNNHSLHFKSISVAPSLPIHCNCRCVYILASAVTEPMPTYQEYIESLSDEEQYHILGKSRYEYFKQGVPLERFVNNGTKLTLDELQKSLVKGYV